MPRAGDLLLFAMEYVAGHDLSKIVKSRGPLPIANAAYYAHQVAQGLQYAAEHGMVHRDIKPSNLILLVENKRHIVKILDFGLAKASSEKQVASELTGSGEMLGTPDYVAPEQMLDAQKADIRADIYSLGCTLYFLLAGRPPFEGPSVYALLAAHYAAQARPLRELRPEIPLQLATIVERMIAKQPQDRYQTPDEVARALSPFFRERRAADAAPASAGEDVPTRATSAGESSAASGFDPHYQWLAIPPEDQPADYYGLLGANPLESNREALRNLAEQRMDYVNRFRQGERAAAAEKLLVELNAARGCLLNAARKAAYDETLWHSLEPDAAAAATTALAPAEAKPAPARVPGDSLLGGSLSGLNLGGLNEISVAPPAPKPQFGGRRRLPPMKVVVGSIFFGGMLLFAALVIRVRTEQGMLVVEVSESNAEILVDGQHATVRWGDDGRQAEITVPAGTRRVEVKKDGFKLLGEEVEIGDRGRRVLVAKLEPLDKHFTSEQPTTAESMSGKAQETAGSALPHLLAAVATSVQTGDLAETPIVGFHGQKGDSQTHRKPDGDSVLVGFKVTTQRWRHTNLTCISAIEPVFLSSSGSKSGPRIGTPGVQGTKVEQLIARPGYAVGLVRLRAPTVLECLQLKFMRITPEGLDPMDSYDSAWAGSTPDRPDELTTLNRPIVGLVCESSAGQIERLGLAYARLSPPRPASSDAAIAAAKLPMVDQITLRNAHNGDRNDTGTKKCNLVLYRGGKEVWAKRNIDMPWEANQAKAYETPVPGIAADRARLEILEWNGRRGGMAEMEVYVAGQNIARGASVTVDKANRTLPGAGQELVDGLTESNIVGSGDWMLEPSETGWADVALSEWPPRPFLGEPVPEITRITLHNAHQTEQGNYGTLTCNLQLFREDRLLWSRQNVNVRWSPTQDVATSIDVPAVPATLLRVEIPRLAGQGAALAEVQAFAGADNLALHCPLRTSGNNPGVAGTPQALVDDRTTSEGKNALWVAPERTTAWLEIALSSSELLRGKPSRVAEEGNSAGRKQRRPTTVISPELKAKMAMMPPAIIEGDWAFDEASQAVFARLLSPQFRPINLSFGDPAWTDYDFSATMQVEECNRLDRFGELFYEARLQEGRSRWQLDAFGPWGAHNQDLRLFYERDAWSYARRWLPGAVQLEIGRPYKITMRMRGTKITILYDGREICTSEHARILAGRVGLVSCVPGAVRFSEIEVSDPSGKLLWHGLPEPPKNEPSLATSLDAKPKWSTDDKGFKALFNGKDLTGWQTAAKDKDLWCVVDSILVSSGRGAPSYLYSTREYENCHLRARVRISDGGNSGILVRAPLYFANPFANTYEADVIGPDDSGGLCSLLGNPRIRQLARRGEWLTAEVIAEGNHFQVFINGVRTADFVDPKPRQTRGYVALQRWHDENVVEFQTVEIKELPPTKPIHYVEGEPIDLLAKIDPSRDAASGTWRRDGDWLISPNDRPATLALPVGPPQDYRLTVAGEHQRGDSELHAGLVTAGNPMTVVINGWGRSASGVALLDGQNGIDNPLVHRERDLLGDNRQYTVECEVHPYRLTVKVNGKQIIDSFDSPDRFSRFADPAFGDRNKLCVGAVGSVHRINRIVLTPLRSEAGEAPSEPRSDEPGPTAKNSERKAQPTEASDQQKSAALDKLRKAKEKYDARLKQLHDTLDKSLTIKELELRKDNQAAKADGVKAEHDAFLQKGTLPQAVPTKEYTRQLRQARTALATAYRQAIKEVMAAGGNTTTLEDEVKALERSARLPPDAKEFHGKYYKLIDVELTWHEARDRCVAMGGHLAIVTSAEENEFLTKMLAAVPTDACWLGGTDENQEGRWLWGNGTPLKYTNWDSLGSQPNNKGGDENYLVLWGARGGVWCDQPDRSIEHHPVFICQWD
ncbi:MAG TPA: family 16 glycoside hydrolase [Pirellulales bacterium]|nr:family 16 glycoside hydrolase [Pirellulales bacterium]